MYVSLNMICCRCFLKKRLYQIQNFKNFEIDVTVQISFDESRKASSFFLFFFAIIGPADFYSYYSKAKFQRGKL